MEMVKILISNLIIYGGIGDRVKVAIKTSFML